MLLAFYSTAGPLRLAFLYVLSMWIVAGGITLWIYLARSVASFAGLLASAARASVSAVWLVPGALLLTLRSQPAIGAGLIAIVGGTCLLVARLVPPGTTIRRKRRRTRGETEPLLFRYQSETRSYLVRQAGPAFLGTLALQTGIYALSGEYPLLAAASFGTATAILTAMSVSRRAKKRAVATPTPYSALRMLLTLLLAVALTAALLHTAIAREEPGTPTIAEIPAVTRSLLRRMAHVPPVPAATPDLAGSTSKEVVTRLVNPAGSGVPGVIMRPRIQPNPRAPLTEPGARPRMTPTEALAFPFTGEYHLFRANSGGLPRDAIVETGTPLEHVYAMNDGAPMQTVAVQTLATPIDLSLWSKVLVTLTNAETAPVLASMQLVSEDSVEDGGTDLMGMSQARKQVLEFQVPFTRRPLLVHAIWISFLRPGPDREKNVQLAVERLTFVPR